MESSTSHVISKTNDDFEPDEFSMFLENVKSPNDKLKLMVKKAVVGNSSIESDADGEKKYDVYLQPSQMLSRKNSMSPPLSSDNMMDQIILGEDGGSTHSNLNADELMLLRRSASTTSIIHNESTNTAEKYAAMARTSAELANTVAISARAHTIVNLNATVTECGAYQWPDGSVYEGDWRFGRRHGKGNMHACSLPSPLPSPGNMLAHL